MLEGCRPGNSGSRRMCSTSFSGSPLTMRAVWKETAEAVSIGLRIGLEFSASEAAEKKRQSVARTA